MNNLNIAKVVTAGLVATLAMTVIMLMGPVMGMPKMDMGTMLGPMNPMVQMPYWMGWVLHFIMGIVLTGIYAAFLLNLLPSDGWKRGLIWGVILFVVVQLVVSPIMGSGIFSGGHVLMIMGSLLGHIVYGVLAGLLYGDG